MGSRAAREIPVVALLAGQREYLAAEGDGDPRARRRDGGLAQVFGALGVAGAQFGQFAGHGQLQACRSRAARVEQMQEPRLFVQDPVPTGGQVHHREVRVPGQAGHGLGGAVVAVEIEFAVPIRAEVEGIAKEARVSVVAASLGLRHLDEGQGL